MAVFTYLMLAFANKSSHVTSKSLKPANKLIEKFFYNLPLIIQNLKTTINIYLMAVFSFRDMILLSELRNYLQDL